jgi:hypothetical protein
MSRAVAASFAAFAFPWLGVISNGDYISSENGFESLVIFQMIITSRA